MSNIPDAEKVFNDLYELFPVVNAALEHGTFQAREFFQNQNKTINKSLAPNLVRYYAKMMLQGDGREVFEEDGKFYINQIPNNGLCIIHHQYWIRILKSAKGELPTPGQSKTKQRFYSQEQYLFKFPSSEEIKKENVNLLLLWETDSHYNLRNLTLACPKAGNTTTESVEIYWHREIPNSILHAVPTYGNEAGESKEEELDLVIKQPIVQKKVDSE